jgi:hypothetical protein
MTVAFKELAGSPVETYSAANDTAQRHLLCAWEDRQALIAELLAIATDGGAIGAPYPADANRVVTSIQVIPFEARPDDQGAFTDVTSQLNNYSGQFAELTVTYEPLPLPANLTLPDSATGTLLTYQTAYTSEQLALPGRAMRWQSDNTLPVSPDTVPSLYVPILEHYLTWHRVSNPPWATIRGLVGCVNGGTFLGAAPETLLLAGVKIDPEFIHAAAAGTPPYVWAVQYVFQEKAIQDDSGAIYGWNYGYRSLPADSPGFDRLVDAAGNSLYRLVNFAPLVQYEGDTP